MTKETKKKIKKLIPWVIGGAVLGATGFMIYRKGHANGYLAGVMDGMHEGVDKTIKAIADHISEPNNFCLYKNSAGVPTFFTGLSINQASDAKTAIDLLEVMTPSPTKEIYEKSITSLADQVFGVDKSSIISAVK